MVNTRVVVSRGQGHNHGATFSTIEANSNDERWAEAARKKSESRKEHTNQPSTEEVRGNSKMRSRRKITKKKVAGSASNGDGEELTHKTYANKIEEEISASNCFKCGKKRHWKRECPKESDYESEYSKESDCESEGDLSMMTVNDIMCENYEVVLDN